MTSTTFLAVVQSLDMETRAYVHAWGETIDVLHHKEFVELWNEYRRICDDAAVTWHMARVDFVRTRSDDCGEDDDYRFHTRGRCLVAAEVARPEEQLCVACV